MRQRFAQRVVKLARWKFMGEVPRRGILVGAPHTSNWDFVSMLIVMWHGGIPPRVLIKKELFRGPLGWLLRKMGGIPIDRENPGSLVRELIKQARSGKDFLLIIAPEGTRGKGEYWKSGFYRIARATKLPISLAFCEPSTRTLGFGLTFHPSGNVKDDMDMVRAFYTDKHGIRPKFATVPRLHEEAGTR